MSALDTAKEIVRITSTAGLSKDVIDLLEKKLEILTEQLAMLENESANLKLDNSKLRQQVQNLQPVGFQKHLGIFWKRTDSGFEPRPYCPECPSRPVMSPFPPGLPDFWACPSDHTFDYGIKPPSP